MRSLLNIYLPSISPNQGVDLGHINVVELLHRCGTLSLISIMNTTVLLSSVIFMLAAQGELDDIMIKLIALPRVIGLPLECRGPPRRWVMGSLFLWLWMPFSTAFLAFQAFVFGFGVTWASFFAFCMPSSWKGRFLF